MFVALLYKSAVSILNTLITLKELSTMNNRETIKFSSFLLPLSVLRRDRGCQDQVLLHPFCSWNKNRVYVDNPVCIYPFFSWNKNRVYKDHPVCIYPFCSWNKNRVYKDHPVCIYPSLRNRHRKKYKFSIFISIGSDSGSDKYGFEKKKIYHIILQQKHILTFQNILHNFFFEEICIYFVADRVFFTPSLIHLAVFIYI